MKHALSLLLVLSFSGNLHADCDNWDPNTGDPMGYATRQTNVPDDDEEKTIVLRERFEYNSIDREHGQCSEYAQAIEDSMDRKVDCIGRHRRIKRHTISSDYLCTVTCYK